MKATLKGTVVAASDDIVENGGYHYFPRAAVCMEWLEKVPKTPSDHACPHGVQFFDVVVNGTRAARAAWSYEAPQPSKIATASRIGFWQDVEVG
jgi:uncharacterized protein (DUF427 family)